MTSDELLEILSGIRATVVLGYVGIEYTLRHVEAFTADIRGKHFGIRIGEEPGRPGYGLSLDALADLLADQNNRQVLRRNINLFMKQDLVRTAYEHIAHYCEEHGRFDEMRAQPWWMFARIIRNTISHKTGARIHMWPKGAPDTVTWKGHTLQKADVDKDIDFGGDDAFYLFDEMVGFARTLT
jgi:hypothetical protein